MSDRTDTVSQFLRSFEDTWMIEYNENLEGVNAQLLWRDSCVLFGIAIALKDKADRKP